MAAVGSRDGSSRVDQMHGLHYCLLLPLVLLLVLFLQYHVFLLLFFLLFGLILLFFTLLLIFWRHGHSKSVLRILDCCEG